jgi:MFS family permease
MTYLGLTVAPSFGGLLTSALSWRAVFYINVPVGLLALLMSWRFIPAEPGSERAERFDLAGALLFMGGLVSLLLGLNQGHAWGWLSPGILGLLAAAVAFLGLFLWVETRHPFPLLDLHLFQNRIFSASVASALLNYMALFSLLFVLPFYLLQGRSLDPAQAGLILTAQPVVMALVAPISGTLSDRIGVQLPGVLGMAMLALGLFALSRLGPETPLAWIMAGLGVVGLGTGTFISPNNSALMGSAPRQRQGIAAAILATARSGGMVLGVGLSGAIFTTVMAHSGSEFSIFRATSASLLVAGGIALVGVITAAVRGQTRARQAKSNVVS